MKYSASNLGQTKGLDGHGRDTAAQEIKEEK
jgi:hypothetical protein